MHKNNKMQRKTVRKTKIVANRIPIPRAGTTNRPPENSGTVQVPRPMTVKSSIQKRVFKAPITLTTPATGALSYGFQLYAPFNYTSLTSGGPAITPASFTNMLNTYGLFKPKRIQLIFEPLIPQMSAIVPFPFTVVMSPEILTLTGLNLAQLESYQNSTKVHPLTPNELSYVIPTLAAGQTNAEVLKGGWITNDNYNALYNSGMTIVYIPSTYVTASTAYTQLTLAYEVWFKDPI